MEGSNSSDLKNLPTTTVSPDANSLTNFIPLSGRSSGIRAMARIESEGILSGSNTYRRKSLPTIHEKEEKMP